jgi:hypothetical protein
MARVQVCNNHLSEFYHAVQEGNIPLIGELEHELSEEEKCVACTYVFKTQGTVKEALEAYLAADGAKITVSPKTTTTGEFMYWLLRIGVFSTIFIGTLFLAATFKQQLFGVKTVTVFSFNILEYTFVLLVSLLVFVFIDDTFFD